MLVRAAGYGQPVWATQDAGETWFQMQIVNPEPSGPFGQARPDLRTVSNWTALFFH